MDSPMEMDQKNSLFFKDTFLKKMSTLRSFAAFGKKARDSNFTS